jgi:CHC2 zinc finger
MSDNNDLRGKIDQAKRRLPLPELMAREGLGDRAKKTAHCPFHDDEHKSFSVFQDKDGFWHYKCFAGCGDGDEIMFLRKLKGLPLTEAMSLYLEMAGFPPRLSHRSHECHKSPRSHECPECPECHRSPKSPVFPVFPVSPMSNGQGLQKALKELGARNACNKRITVKKALWQLARDLRALEKQIGRKLSNGELMLVFDGWHPLSEPFLDPAKTRDDYLEAFLAKPAKVRIPTGEGDTLNKALETVAKLSPDELPVIPKIPHASERLRRVAALHRELSRLCGSKTYFLTCRDTAKVFPGLRHQAAWNINGALAQLGVVEVVRAGDPHPGGRASQFRYLLA